MKKLALFAMLLGSSFLFGCEAKKETKPVDKPAVDKPADAPADKPADAPADKPADAPADKPADAK